MSTKLQSCSIDSYVNQDKATTKNGTATALVMNGTTSHKKYALLFFPKPMPAAVKSTATVTVTSAILTFYLNGAWSGSNVVTVKRVTSNWAESKVDWNTAPTVVTGNDVSVTVTSGADKQAVTVDVTAMFGDVAAGDAYYGLRLEIAGSSDRAFWSGEAAGKGAGLQPTLDVTWAQLPAQPTDLKPTDSSVVDDVGSVLVNWTFSDQDATGIQAFSQVQVDDSSDLGSPLWDSGTQPNSIQQETLGYDIQIFSITGTPTGGHSTITFGADTTGSIAFNAAASDVETALNLLASVIAAGGVTVTDLGAPAAGLPGDSMAIRFNQGGVRASMTTTDSLTGGSTPASAIGHTGTAYDSTNGLVGIALPNNSTRYWRVQVTDQFGGVSPWSVIQSFDVIAKGAVAITYPSTTLAEQSPEVTWTFSGTQTAYQVLLTQALTGFVVYDSGLTTSSNLFDTIPPGLINVTDSGFYNLEVRVWDDQVRVANNGDPEYATDSVTGITYTPSSGADPVLTLTAVAAESPGVVLTWTRTDPPDYFALQVDPGTGTLKTPAGTDAFGNTWDRLVPGDYLVSGDTYSLTWLNARPQVEANFEVNAVVYDTGVYGVTAGDPQASATPDPAGLWFVHSITGDAVVLLTTNQRASYEWDIGEEATEYYPIGRQDPVRVTTSLRGYEGTVQGELRDFSDSLTADIMRQNLEQFKSELGAYPIRLIVQGINIPVRIGAMKLSPLHPIGYNVSIDFSQIGEFAISPPSL